MFNYWLVLLGVVCLLLVFTNSPALIEYVFYNLALDVLELFGVRWNFQEGTSGNKIYDLINEKIHFLKYFHKDELVNMVPYDIPEEERTERDRQFRKYFENQYLNKKEE